VNSSGSYGLASARDGPEARTASVSFTRHQAFVVDHHPGRPIAGFLAAQGQAA
jgi:hypothetical protein